MSEQPTDVQTIIAAITIPALTALLFPGKIIGLDVYTPLLLLILAYWGIQSVRKAAVLSFDLFPGYLTNKELVGLDAILCLVWLASEGAMPYEEAWTFILMILAAIGFVRLARKQ